MKFAAAYGPNKFGLSFELFPPKTAAGEDALWRNLEELMAYRPSFVTCTYGAGGSTREKTLEIVTEVRRRYGCAVASHLTCVGSTADQLRCIWRRPASEGLKTSWPCGDPPRGETTFTPVAGGLKYANELVALIRSEFPHFGIAVAGYPETHQEAPSPAVDLENLKRKVAAGGEVVITQVFFNNADFFAFSDRCRAAGIQAPIVPGILPATNFAQVMRMTQMCGAKLPETFLQKLTAAGDDEGLQFEIGVGHAINQVRELIAAGVPGIHFYVLNKSPATVRVLEAMRK